jgi:hypothetical protein
MTPVARLFGPLLRQFQREGEQKQVAYQQKRSQWTDLQRRLRAAQLEERLRGLGDQPPPGQSPEELETRLEAFHLLLRQKAQVQSEFDLEQETQAAAEQGPVPPEPEQPPGLEQVTLRHPGLGPERVDPPRRQELLEQALAALVGGSAGVEVLEHPLGSARVPGAQLVLPVEVAEPPSSPDHQ